MRTAYRSIIHPTRRRYQLIKRKPEIRLLAQFVVPQYTPHFVMLGIDVLSEEGLAVRAMTAEHGLMWWDYLRSGEADIAFGGSREAYKVADQGLSERFVGFAEMLQRNPFFLLGRSPEPNFQWQHLVGKSVVGVNLATTQIFKEYALRKNGVDPKKVLIIRGLTFEEQVAAFRAGIGDYLEHTQPVVEDLVSSGAAYLIVPIGQATGLSPFTVYTTTASFMGKNPETLERFARAFYRAQLWMAEHTPREVAELIKPWFAGLETDKVSRMIESYRVVDIWTQNPVPRESDYDHIRDMMLLVGALKRKIPYREVANPEFALRAVNNLGG